MVHTPRTRFHLRSLLGWAAACLAAGGCADAAGEEPGPVRVPFEPAVAYAALWEQVEDCSGRRGDPARVRWYRTAAFPGRPRRLGQWEPGHVITLRDDLLEALPIVSHEILHDLLDGDPHHRDPAWLACALPVAGARGGAPPLPGKAVR